MSEPTADQTPESIGVDDISPLRGLMAEVHEIYEELRYAGFEDNAAAQIIAHMLSDLMVYRAEYQAVDDEDEDGEDDLI